MTKYAIIKTGGKQYKVETGNVIDVELLEGSEKGPIEFKEVLLFSDESKVTIGTPMVAKAVVLGEIVDQVRGPKVIAYKYKKRKNYRRKVGHRQNYLRVKITGLNYVT
ncbi:MAG: 50S ribosomal protein L21 [Chlamydiae bacterium]|nr:50S ribosomal protein L21 [Chlamydiota bacterium]